MKKLRTACLGIGPRLQGVIECYSVHPQIEFIAFADIALNRAEAFAAAYNKKHGANARAYTCYEDLMKNECMDILLIGIDSDKQVDYAVDAMHKGVHVMTEVPAAYTIEQCWKLVNAVKTTGVKYQLAEQTRYWNFIKEWRRMAAAGEFGKIYYAEGEYLHYEPVWDLLRDKKTNYAVYPKSKEDLQNPDYVFSWRHKIMREPIYYLPHQLSPLLSVTGGRIEKVSCIGLKKESYTEQSYDASDLQTALMYNSNDVIFSLKAGFASPYGLKSELGGHWYQIKGTKASVETSRSMLDTMKKFTVDGGWEVGTWGISDPNAPEHIRNAPHGGTDYYPILYFIESILNDTIPPMDVYKAVESAAPAILAAESARKGGVLLEIPDFRV